MCLLCDVGLAFEDVAIDSTFFCAGRGGCSACAFEGEEGADLDAGLAFPPGVAAGESSPVAMLLFTAPVAMAARLYETRNLRRSSEQIWRHS
jgi:hypothetical protein